MERVSIPVMPNISIDTLPAVSILTETASIPILTETTPQLPEPLASIEVVFDVPNWESIVAMAINRDPMYVTEMKMCDLAVRANTFSLNGISFTTWVYPNCFPIGTQAGASNQLILTNSFTGFTDENSIPDDAELKVTYRISVWNPVTEQYISSPEVAAWILTKSRPDVGYPWLDKTFRFGSPLVEYNTLRLKINWTILESNFDFDG